jgi:type IV pilus assembly protein PilA
MEMVIVLAIIAILALMTVPSYQDRLVREQISAALPLADVAKTPVALSWASLQTFPATNEDAGLPVAEKIVSNLVSSVTVRGGAIDIRFGNSVNGTIKDKTLTLRPAVVEDSPIVPIAWICAAAPVPGGMAVKGEDKTDIAERYLPIICRGK